MFARGVADADGFLLVHGVELFLDELQGMVDFRQQHVFQRTGAPLRPAVLVDQPAQRLSSGVLRTGGEAGTQGAASSEASARRRPRKLRWA